MKKNIVLLLVLALLPFGSAQAADVFDFFNTTIDFFNDLLDFKDLGIYKLITAAFSKFVIWSTVAMIKTKIFMVSFAWDVAKEILISLNISSLIAQAWSSLDSVVLNLLTYFKIPEAINIVLSAHLTKYVLRFVGL